MPKKPENAAIEENGDTPLSTTSYRPLKQLTEKQMRREHQEIALQLARRSVENVDWQFEPKTCEDLRVLQIELMHKRYSRELSENDVRLGIDAIRNLYRIFSPDQRNGLTVNVEQNVATLSVDIQRFMKLRDELHKKGEQHSIPPDATDFR